MTTRNPWLSMWIKPRETIRTIVSTNPKKRLWALSWLYGFSTVLYFFQIYGVGSTMGLWLILLSAFVVGPFWGYVSFSIQSWVVQQTGKLLKAKSDFSAIRAAMAWSCVTFWVNVVLWGFLCLYFGHSLFEHFPGGRPLTSLDVTVLMLVMVCKLAAGIWSLVIYLRSLSEVQNYSIGLAIVNVIMTMVIFFILTILLQLALGHL